MFELDGEQYTQQDILDFATQKEMSEVDALDYLKGLGLKEVEEPAVDVFNIKEDIKEKLEDQDLTKTQQFLLDKATQTSLTESLIANLAKSTVNIIGQGAEDILKTGVRGWRAAARGISYEDAINQLEDVDIADFEKANEFFDQFRIKNLDEQGQEMDFLDLANKGEYGKAATAFVNEAAGALPSLAISMMPGGYAYLGLTTGTGNFERDIRERTDQKLSDIAKNSIVKGAADFVGEFVGNRLLLGGGKLINRGVPKQQAVDLMQEGVKKFANKAGLGFIYEAAPEAITGVIQEYADEAIYGDQKTASDYFRTALHDGLIGGFLGSGVTVTRAPDKAAVYNYVAPKAFKAAQLKTESDLIQAQADLEKAPTGQKKFFQDRVSGLEEKLKTAEQRLFDVFDNMSKGEKQKYAANEDVINNSLSIIGNPNYTIESQNAAKEQMNNAIQANADVFGSTKLAYDPVIEKIIGERVAEAETLQDQLDKKGVTPEDVNVEILETPEQVEEVGMKGSEGVFLSEGKDGKPTIYINKQRAAEVGQTNVLGHELLHYVTSRNFKVDDASLKPLVDSFKEYIGEVAPNVLERIEARLDENYTNPDGSLKKGALEEYFNIFSDIVAKEKIDVNESVADKIKNTFRSYYRGLGFGNVEFNSGKDVFNFIKDYNKNLNRQGLLGKLTGKKILKTDIKVAEELVGKPDPVTVEQVVKESRGYEKTDRDKKIDELGDRYTKKRWDAIGADTTIGKIYEDLEAMIRANISGELQRTPGFSLEDFVSETLAELIPHIRNFDITKKQDNPKFGLSGWIRGQIKNKIGNVIKKRAVTKEAFEQDITEEAVSREAEFQAAEEVTIDEDIDLTEAVEDAEQVSTFRRVLTVDGKQGIPERIVQDVRDAVLKTMATERLTPDSDQFIANVKKAYLTELKKPIQDMMGTKFKFEEFLRENKEAIITALPTSTLVQMERNVDPADRAFTKEIKRNLSPTEVDEAIAKDQLPKGTNRTSGPTLYEKVMPTTVQFLKYFNPPLMVPSKKDPSKMVRSGLKGTRKDTLAEQMGIELAFDATMETVQDPKVAERRALVTGGEFAEAQIAELAKAISRGVDLKFSKTKIRHVAGMGKAALEIIKKLKKDPNYVSIDFDEDGKKTYSIPDPLVKSWRDQEYSKQDQQIIIEEALKTYRSRIFGKLNDFEVAKKVLQRVVRDGVQVNKAYEQEFINVMGKTMKDLNSTHNVNRFVEEGGKGDVYIESKDNLVGIEIKMDEADGVSQTAHININKDGDFEIELSNPINDPAEDVLKQNMVKALKGLNLDLKEANLPEITNKNVRIGKRSNKPQIIISPEQAAFINLNSIKSGIIQNSFVDNNYIMEYYGMKSLPEGFIQAGSKLYHMVTGNDKADRLTQSIVQKMPESKRPPLFQNKDNAKFRIDMNLTSKPAGQGNEQLVFRVMPKIFSKDLVKSNVNLLDKADAKIFGKAVDSSLTEFDNVQEVDKAKFSKTTNKKFNEIIERNKGVDADEIISEAVAKRKGKNINKFQIFVPPGAEDFAGLLYYFMGKGKEGEADMKFFKETLLDPLSRGEQELAAAKQRIVEDFEYLKAENREVQKIIGKLIPDSDFTYGTAIRVYLWDRAGFDIPGISDAEKADLINEVTRNEDLLDYARDLGRITRLPAGYVKPGDNWSSETIANDLYNLTTKVGRKGYISEFIENTEIIFSKDNLNKIESIYGSDYRSALEDILYRIKNGTNRPSGANATTNKWLNWLNNSVGAIMFLNTRSAVLQLLSTVNYVNWSDNNPLKAAKAFANQPQYWKDFAMIFNSKFLKQRRSGLSTDINEAEIANAVAGAKNKAQAAIAFLLKKGFLPTQMADSFAISAGGATFYRNRLDSYLEQGFNQEQAEEKAFTDLVEKTEEAQQSARPDRISQQQASVLGRIVLAFQNTPMQYARIIKKATLDIINKRGDIREHVSKIIFYGGVQGLIFGAMQSALFAGLFDDEEEDKTPEQIKEAQELRDKQVTRTLNTMIDGLLSGAGLKGKVIAQTKNTINAFLVENKKDWGFRTDKILLEALNISPPLGSKARKLVSASNNYVWNKKAIENMKWSDPNNPAYDSVANVVEATTNLPMARAMRKIDNLSEAFNDNNESWRRLALLMGWSQWDLGIEGEKRKAIKEAKKGKRCTAITSEGKRCKNTTDNESGLCYAHD